MNELNIRNGKLLEDNRKFLKNLDLKDKELLRMNGEISSSKVLANKL